MILKKLKLDVFFKIVLIISILLYCFPGIEVKAVNGAEDKAYLKQLNKMAGDNIQIDPDKALELSQEAEKLAEKYADNIELVNSLINSGLAYMQLGKNDNAKESFDKARALSIEIQYKEGEGDSENQLGNICFEQGLYDNAMKHFVRAVDIRREINDNIGLSKSINNMGRVQERLSNYDKAIDLFKEALMLKGDQDKTGRVNTLNNLGIVYRSKGELDLALTMFKESLSIANEINYPLGLAYGNRVIGETYRIKGDFNKAEEYVLNSIKLYKKINYKQAESHALYGAGMIYFEMGKLDKALEYHDAALTIAKEIKQKDLISNISLEKSKVLERKGQYKDALILYKDYMKLNQEVLNTDMQQKILALQNDKEMQAKEQEIDLLKKVSQVEKSKISFQKLLLIAVVLMLIMISLFSVYLLEQSAMRKKKEKQLIEVKEELENANEQLSFIASRDFLTKLYNRRYFYEASINMADRCKISGGNISFVLGDIDFFKQYNDIYGHPIGDKCLVLIAEVLSESFSDEYCLVARYGGEEFIIAMEAPREEALLKTNMARERIEALNIANIGSQFDKVTCSFGLACSKDIGSYDIELLIDSADKMLYEAKRTGRNKVVSS